MLLRRRDQRGVDRSIHRPPEGRKDAFSPLPPAADDRHELRSPGDWRRGRGEQQIAPSIGRPTRGSRARVPRSLRDAALDVHCHLPPPPSPLSVSHSLASRLHIFVPRRAFSNLCDCSLDSLVLCFLILYLRLRYVFFCTRFSIRPCWVSSELMAVSYALLGSCPVGCCGLGSENELMRDSRFFNTVSLHACRM